MQSIILSITCRTVANILNSFVMHSLGLAQCIGNSAKRSLNENEAIEPGLPPYISG